MVTKPIVADASLNEQQNAAVTADINRHLLVLAGAGSGKTRVLVQRITWLIQHYACTPGAILAVTFTNKAANEMRERLQKQLGFSVRGMWVGTFHSLAHRLLRAHWQAAQLPEHFQILDADDQYRLVRRTLKSLNLSENEWPPREAQWFINHKKDDGLRPQHIHCQGDHHLSTMVRIYQAYEQACQRAGVIDFAELLLRAHELWRNNPDILQHYQQRFSHILIDEFQDTNTIQYAWVKLLAGKGAHVMVVGDDDQSIYGWRGAKIENIQRFQQDFADTQLIRLEQNYRSTATILNAANQLIANNHDRMGKALWTDGSQGQPIALYPAYNELDEARFIVEYIESWHRQQHSAYRDIAILYRSNAQSRVLEEALLHSGIPYRIYGGQRFFERAEIKDALAYMRLIATRDDDAAFERIVNQPPRGIGERSVALLRETANAQQCSLWQAAIELTSNKQLAARASNAIVHFLQLIDALASDSHDITLENQLDHVIQNSGLYQHIAKANNEKSQSRLENLDELITAAQQFRLQYEDELPILSAFLTHSVLESGEGQSDANDDCVQLMTLHTAKGLEFPLVFLAGLEEGLFPHSLSISDDNRLQEERRLCYVGMTRAMQQLVISYAEIRRLHGREQYHRASRFIREIPQDAIQPIRNNTTSRASTARHQPSHKRATRIDQGIIPSTDYRLGESVHHSKFGEGVITDYEGSGPNTRVQVQFKHGESKWLVLAYANLSRANA